nr:hypothetical protein [Acetobacter persici]
MSGSLTLDNAPDAARVGLVIRERFPGDQISIRRTRNVSSNCHNFPLATRKTGVVSTLTVFPCCCAQGMSTP